MTYPAADLVTDDAVVVVQQRPIVPFTSWFADTLRRCVESERVLQLVTPADSRITRLLRLVLGPPSSQWVVRTGDGYYDGLSGVELMWNGTAFSPDVRDRAAGGVAADFVRTPGGLTDGLALHVLVRHTDPNRMAIGGAVQLLSEALCDAPPAGWGAAEPVTEPWDPTEITAAFRARRERRTTLVFQVSPAAGATRFASGTVEVAWADGAAEESITMTVGSAGLQEPTPDAQLGELAGRIASRHPLESMLALREPVRADLTVAPRWPGIPAPVGMAVGSGPVRSLGRSRAVHPPNLAAAVVGGTEPAVWYPLADDEPAVAYERLRQLLRHLGIEPFGAAVKVPTFESG